jgi:hypothetical protein
MQKLNDPDIATACDALVQEGRAYAAQVESGHRAIARAPVPQPEPEPAIERTEIYALQNLRWLEGSRVVTVGRYGVAAMPSQLVEAACRRNLATPRTSEHARAVIASFGVIHSAPPPADMCIDVGALDQTAGEPAPRTTLPPGFEERRGPARELQISVSRV